MNRKILSLIAFAISTTAFSQVEILNEDFNNGIPSSWQVITRDSYIPHSNVSEYTQAWIGTDSPTDPSDKCISTTSYFTTAGKADRWIITDAISLGQSGNYMNFKAMSLDPSFPDSYKVMISTSREIDSFTTTVRTIAMEVDQWFERDISLNGIGFEGKTIYLAFVNTSSNGFKLFIDDLTVRKDDPLSTELIDNIQLSVYPNPTQDFLHISTELPVSTISIYSIEGKIVKENEASSVVDVSQLPEGNYFIQLKYSNGQHITRQFIKK